MKAQCSAGDTDEADETSDLRIYAVMIELRRNLL